MPRNKPKRQKVPKLVPGDPFASLPDRQQQFVLEFVSCGNGAASYQRAGFIAKSKRVAASSAYRMLQNATIKAAIEQRQAERIERLTLTDDDLLREAVNIVKSNLKNILDPGKKSIVVRSMADIDPDAMAAVAEISELPDGRIKIKTYSRLAAIELLAKARGLLRDRVDVKVRTGETEDDIRHMTDEELNQIIAEEMAKRGTSGEVEA